MDGSFRAAGAAAVSRRAFVAGLGAAAAGSARAGGAGIDFAGEADRLTDLAHRAFWDPGSAMYRAPMAGAETVASDPAHDRGYVLWPSIEMLHALTLGEAAHRGRYRARIAEVFAGLEKYRHADAHAYNAWLDFPGNMDRYYDDNSIMVRVLVRAAKATGDPRYLERGRDVMEGFVMGGWEPTGRPGGMQWGLDAGKAGTGDRAACATSMAAMAALELAAAGVDAARNRARAGAMMDWLTARLQDTDGLIFDALEPPDWRVRRVKWTYNTGLAIHAHVLLWRSSGDAVRLRTARAMGDAAINRGGALYDGLVHDPAANHWFDSAFFVPYLADGLAELSRATGDRRYGDEVRREAEWALGALRDPADGLYFRNWRLWRIDARRHAAWRAATGGNHTLEADWDERSKEPADLKRAEAERPTVKTLLANAGHARLFRIAARA